MLLIIYTCEPNPLQIYQYIHTPVKVIFCLIFYCSCLIVLKLVRGEDIHSERIICWIQDEIDRSCLPPILAISVSI
jgi:hypothetical protein